MLSERNFQSAASTSLQSKSLAPSGKTWNSIIISTVCSEPDVAGHKPPAIQESASKGNLMSTEEREGYEAYWRGEGVGDNPYIWSNKTWWMVEDWESGWKRAQQEDYDDDD